MRYFLQRLTVWALSCDRIYTTFGRIVTHSEAILAEQTEDRQFVVGNQRAF
jgi:hypothetical protein